MWKCRQCSQEMEDSFESCWNCGTSISGDVDDTFQPEEDPLPDRASEVACMRCNQTLDYLGTRRFHEGTRWGFLGELGELFVNKEAFGVYACPGCGHVEFFVERG